MARGTGGQSRHNKLHTGGGVRPGVHLATSFVLPENGFLNVMSKCAPSIGSLHVNQRARAPPPPPLHAETNAHLHAKKRAREEIESEGSMETGADAGRHASKREGCLKMCSGGGGAGVKGTCTMRARLLEPLS